MDDKAPAFPTKPDFPIKIVFAACMVVLLTFGPRSAMGLFQIPMLNDTGWDRSTFGLALAIQNLFWGLGQPFFGAIADRYGAGRVLLLSSLFYISGLVLTAYAPEPLYLTMGAGVLIGLGIASGSFTVVLAILGRNVSPQKRSFAFGLATASSSLAMFMFTPISQALIQGFGWQDALLWLAGLMLLLPLCAMALRGNAQSSGAKDSEFKQTVGEALHEAFRHKSYLLLGSGFFVCGFQVAFITVHFPAYIADIGIDATYAVMALALIGFFNIIGSLGSGIVGQIYSKAKLLSLIYLGRSIATIAFIMLPQSPLSVIIFASVMGILWLSTVAPTNALVAIMFGTKHLGLLGGLVFLSHQIGSFLGVYLGGFLFDQYGDYSAIWWVSIALGLFAAIVHLPILEKQVNRPQTQMAPAQ